MCLSQLYAAIGAGLDGHQGGLPDGGLEDEAAGIVVVTAHQVQPAGGPVDQDLRTFLKIPFSNQLANTLLEIRQIGILSRQSLEYIIHTFATPEKNKRCLNTAEFAH